MFVGPLAAVYLVWWVADGHTGGVRELGPHSSNTHSAARQFVADGYGQAFHALGHFGGLGWVLLAVLGAGLPLAWVQRRGRAEFASLAVPVALLAGSLGFLATTATSRSSFGASYAGLSWYVSLTVAMVLPAFAVAADALARPWRILVPVTVVVLLAGVPSNVRRVDDGQRRMGALYARTRNTMLSLPRDPIAASAPRSLRPEQVTARYVTIGWLLDGVRSGRIPAPPPLPKIDLLDSSHFRLSFFQTRDAAPTTGCTAVTGPVTMAVRRGEVIGVYDGPVSVEPATRPPLVGFGLLFVPNEGNAVKVLRDVPREVRILPYGGFDPGTVCVGTGMPMPTRPGGV